jgi:hypothetical protein
MRTKAAARRRWLMADRSGMFFHESGGGSPS